MPIPDFQSLMLPILKELGNCDEAPLATIRAKVADALELSPSELAELVPSGRQTKFANRVNWAAVYMTRAGLVNRVRRGTYQIVSAGRQLLAESPNRIDLKTLQRYPNFVEWKRGTLNDDDGNESTESKETPEEMLGRAAHQIRAELETAILERVQAATPAFFEQVVVDLLIAMGYGGGNADQGEVTGKPGDGGIDGTIREDALGLDEVYVQVKKYGTGNSVGEGDLRNFAGAIDAAGTTKGVFVTTSDFTRTAKTYVTRSPKRIVLIDGKDLARLMAVYDIGVRTKSSHQIKRVDEDYFESASD